MPTRDALQPHIATLTAVLDAWRAVGVISLITFYDAILARLLTAAGRPDDARARLQTALDLADDTGMHFYDAELLRLRAHTTDDPAQRHADLVAAIDLARDQDAWLFELRAAIDDFGSGGDSARDALTIAVGRFPAEAPWPESPRRGHCSGEAPRGQGGHPRWRHRGAQCCLAAQ